MELLAIGLSVLGLVFILFVWFANAFLLKYWDNWDRLLVQKPSLTTKNKSTPIVKSLEANFQKKQEQKVA